MHNLPPTEVASDRVPTHKLRKFSKQSPWPKPLEAEAYIGLAGEIVNCISPHTESDPAALLVQQIVAYGSAVGRRPHWLAEADRHGCNLMAVVVGESSKGRKGTSWGHIVRLFKYADPVWESSCKKSGLSSGEGLTYHVRDKVEKLVNVAQKGSPPRYESQVVDEGIEDKRLCDVENEFASVLQNFEREGNKLSAVIRDAWDGRQLSSLTKNSPLKATDPHISIIGHITKTELTRYLSATEQANGLGNRFIWICARRANCLPEGGRVDPAVLASLGDRLKASLERGREIDEVGFDEQAREMWHAIYPNLSRGYPGLLGAMLARSEAQVRRLACIYALMDNSSLVKKPHLKAALCLWDYAEESCRHIFGDGTGDPVADAIMSELRERDGGMSKSEIFQIFNRNRSKEEIDRALESLREIGSATCLVETSSLGRTVERWFSAIQ